MECPIKPLWGNVILKRERLKTNLIVPQEAMKRNAPTKGVMVAKGPGVEDHLEVGKMYIFGAHAGCWLNAGGTPSTFYETDSDFYVCQEEELIGEVNV